MSESKAGLGTKGSSHYASISDSNKVHPGDLQPVILASLHHSTKCKMEIAIHLFPSNVGLYCLLLMLQEINHFIQRIPHLSWTSIQSYNIKNIMKNAGYCKYICFFSSFLHFPPNFVQKMLLNNKLHSIMSFSRDVRNM